MLENNASNDAATPTVLSSFFFLSLQTQSTLPHGQHKRQPARHMPPDADDVGQWTLQLNHSFTLLHSVSMSNIRLHHVFRYLLQTDVSLHSGVGQ
jgi:hypothetical protein